MTRSQGVTGNVKQQETGGGAPTQHAAHTMALPQRPLLQLRATAGVRPPLRRKVLLLWVIQPLPCTMSLNYGRCGMNTSVSLLCDFFWQLLVCSLTLRLSHGQRELAPATSHWHRGRLTQLRPQHQGPGPCHFLIIPALVQYAS